MCKKQRCTRAENIFMRFCVVPYIGSASWKISKNDGPKVQGAINVDSYQVERATFVSNLGRKTLIPISATKQFRLVEIIGPIFALLKFLTASLRIWSLPLCLRRLTTPYFTTNTWFSLIQKLRRNYWTANLALKIISYASSRESWVCPLRRSRFK